MDPYRVLGVEPDASRDELKRAYRALAREWHPDRNPAPGAADRFKEIAAAWEAVQEGVAPVHVRGGPPTHEFLQDFTDALERAEGLVFRLAVPRLLRDAPWLGKAQVVASLAEELQEDTLFRPEHISRWVRWRSWRRLERRVEVVIDYDAPGPPSRTRRWPKAPLRWRIELAPRAFWAAGVRDIVGLDEAVAQHLATQVAVVLAVRAGTRSLPTPQQAAELDRARRRRFLGSAALWGTVGALATGMLLAGWLSG